MRLLVMTLLLLVPAASAGGLPPVESILELQDTGSSAGLEPHSPTPECPDCAGADASVWVGFPRNCMDCPRIGVELGVHHDNQTTASLRACYLAYVGFCVVDRTVTI